MTTAVTDDPLISSGGGDDEPVLLETSSRGMMMPHGVDAQTGLGAVAVGAVDDAVTAAAGVNAGHETDTGTRDLRRDQQQQAPGM